MANMKCPYCMEAITRASVIYQCPTCGKTYPVAGLFRNQIPTCNNTGAHPSNLRASRIICNNKRCGQILPPDFFDYERSLKFSLVGTTNSGKTNFLIVMLHELMHDLKTGLSLGALDLSSASYSQFKSIEKQMFDEHDLPAATTRGAVEPYLWRIRDRNKMHGNIIPSYSLTIYDGAGENFTEIDKDENLLLTRYLCDTETLFILIDPLQLSSFKKRGVGQESVDLSISGEQDAAETLEKVTNYLRLNKGIKSGELINMNIAFIFTKIDALVGENGEFQFGDGELILRARTSSHIGCYDFRRGGFDTKEAAQISKSIHNFLSKHERRFIDVIESNFNLNKVHYFAVSALGGKPVKGDDGLYHLPHIDPIRVLDPFLWMMMKEGFIKELK